MNLNSSFDLGGGGFGKNEALETNINEDNVFNNLEEKNKEIKALFDTNVFEQSMEKEKVRLEDYLEENCFYLLLEKLENGEIEQQELINMPDERIKELVEEENQDKFDDLRDFLMRLDDCNDADDLLNSIDKTIGNETEN